MIDFLLDFRNPVLLGIIATALFMGLIVLGFKLYIEPLIKKIKKLEEELKTKNSSNP